MTAGPITSELAQVRGSRDARRVLVIERDPELNRLICDGLAADYRVATAFDPAQGLELALELAPDVVIAEAATPEMSGVELVRELRMREALAGTSVVLLMPEADAELWETLLRAGAQDHLVKPFSRDELRCRIASALAARGVLANESRLAAIVRDSNDAIMLLGFDGKILAWNEAAERMYGYTEAEALEMNISELVPDGDEPTLAYLEAGRRGEHSPPHELRRRTRDGRILDVVLTASTLVEAGRPVAIATTTRDVTERNRRERALRFDLHAMERLHRISSRFLSEVPHEAILDEILDAAIAISSAAFGNIQVIDTESGALRIVVQRGFSADWVDYWDRWADQRGACGVAHARRERVIVEDVARSPIFAGETLEIQLAAGIRACQSTPLIGRSGSLVGVISTHFQTPHRPPDHVLRMLDLLARQAADVIERARVDAALRRAIEARDRVLGVVAHDLRNPLGSIKLQAEVIRIGASASFDAIERAADRMTEIIDELLDVAKLDAGRLVLDRQRLSADVLVKENAESQAGQIAAASLALRIEGGADLPAVWADRARIARVFENLVSNALKFTKSGSITLGVRRHDHEMCFWVADTGDGIPAEHVPHVFERFWRPADSSRSGAGLGLAIVKGIVEAHGGRLWVESVVDKGSRFVFTLPVASEREQVTDRAAAAPGAPGSAA